MKLLLGLAGLLAVLIMLQPSEGALPGNSSETGKAGMLRVVLSPWDSLPPCKPPRLWGPKGALGPFLTS